MHTHGLTKHAALQSLVRAYTHMGWPKHGNISACVPPAIIQSDPPEQSKQTMCCDEHLTEHLNVMTRASTIYSGGEPERIGDGDGDGDAY